MPNKEKHKTIEIFQVFLKKERIQTTMTSKMEVEEDTSSSILSASEKNFDSIMRDLEEAEDNLQRLLEIASETCGQLTEAPLCEYDQLKSLAKEYNTLLMSTSKLVKQHFDILDMEPILRSKVDFTPELDAIDRANERIREEEKILYPDVVILGENKEKDQI